MVINVLTLFAPSLGKIISLSSLSRSSHFSGRTLLSHINSNNSVFLSSIIQYIVSHVEPGTMQKYLFNFNISSVEKQQCY